jgi:hypothetical protein
VGGDIDFDNLPGADREVRQAAVEIVTLAKRDRAHMVKSLDLIV